MKTLYWNFFGAGIILRQMQSPNHDCKATYHRVQPFSRKFCQYLCLPGLVLSPTSLLTSQFLDKTMTFPCAGRDLRENTPSQL